MKTDLIYANLIIKMTEYFKGDTRRIQHFLKVYSFAETIALLEQLDAYSLHILKTAAIVHDIGIKISEEKYGDSSGKHQELEGIAPAHKMLTELNFDTKTIERVCWLISHHHTYENIIHLDHRILIESDFLVNMCEDSMDKIRILSIYNKIFRTHSGRLLCRNLFSLDDIILDSSGQTAIRISSNSEELNEWDCAVNNFNKEETEIHKNNKDELGRKYAALLHKDTIFQSSNIIPAYMVSDKCNGCGTCIDVCPVQCIDIKRIPAYIRQEESLHCGSCASVCIKNAIINFNKNTDY